MRTTLQARYTLAMTLFPASLAVFLAADGTNAELQSVQGVINGRKRRDHDATD